MQKFISLLFIIVSFNANAAYESVRSDSIWLYDNPQEYYMERNMKQTSREDGQITLEDYEDSIGTLTRRERKRHDNPKKNFSKIDYNKDGLVSADEYKRYTLINEKNRKKTKNEERIIRRKKKEGRYTDPQIEIDKLTKKIEEEAKKAKE